MSALAERVGTKEAQLVCGDQRLALGDGEVGHAEAVDRALDRVMQALPAGQALAGVGHRVVHGGDRFSECIRIDDQVEAAIAELTSLAPLHNPANLAGIQARASPLARAAPRRCF